MGSILCPAVEARFELALLKAEVAMRTPISGTRRTTLWLLVSARLARGALALVPEQARFFHATLT